MKELLGNAARVRNMHCKLAFNISSKKKSRSEIALEGAAALSVVVGGGGDPLAVGSCQAAHVCAPVE